MVRGHFGRKKKKTIEKEQKKDELLRKQLKERAELHRLQYQNEIESNEKYVLKQPFLLNSSYQPHHVEILSHWSQRRLIRSHFFQFEFPKSRYPTYEWDFFRTNRALSASSKKLFPLKLLPTALSGENLTQKWNLLRNSFSIREQNNLFLSHLELPLELSHKLFFEGSSLFTKQKLVKLHQKTTQTFTKLLKQK